MKRELKEHFLILIALVLLSSLAWTGTVYQAGSMGLGMITCSMTMGTPFSVGNALLYVLLWGVMMVAMMFPAIVPVVGLFSTVAGRKREQGVPFTPAWVFVAGYLVLWTLAGGVGYTVDLAIQSLPEVFPALRTYGLVIGGLTLIAAGVYQLTPLKYLCLSQCRSPMGFLLTSWRDGALGAFRGPAPDGPGFWFPPTVLAPVSNDDRAAREEIFGPVACVIPFDGEEEAVTLANDTIYGLSGSIWTQNGARALRVARALETGTISINSNTSVRVSTPFGGFKQSGVGRELGPHALEHYTELKNVFMAT